MSDCENLKTIMDCYVVGDRADVVVSSDGWESARDKIRAVSKECDTLFYRPIVSAEANKLRQLGVRYSHRWKGVRGYDSESMKQRSVLEHVVEVHMPGSDDGQTLYLLKATFKRCKQAE